jgi:integrase
MAVIKRKNGRWYPRVSPKEPVARCADHNHPNWLLDGRVDRCRKCGGELRDPNFEPHPRFGGQGYRTKKAAQAAERAMATTVADEGKYSPPSTITVAELSARWLDAEREQVRQGAWDAKKMRLDRVLPLIGGLRVRDLTGDIIEATINNLTGRYGRLLAARTRQTTFQVLKHMLSAAVRWHLIPRNPADDAKPPRVTDHLPMATWSADELRRFLDATADHRLHGAFVFAARSGARRGEVLGLAWDAIDLDRGTASIRQSLVDTSGGPKFEAPKTKRSRRIIDLDATTVAALRDQRKHQIEDRLRAGSAWTDSGLVFTAPTGSFVDPDTFSAAFEQAVRRAAVPRIRLHDLRHTHATLLLLAGVHPKVVSERLGHANIGITLDTYSHVLPTMGRDAADAFGALLDGASGAAT